MIRSFGRHVARDKRDLPLVSLPPTKRTKRKWRDDYYTGNQGSTPQCVGYACSHWLASAPLRQFINPTGIYTLAQHIDEWAGTDYDGTSVRAGMKVLHKLGFISEYRFSSDLETIISTVLSIGPMVVGTDWFSGMMRTNSKGFIKPTGSSEGGHAYLLCGVDTKKKVLTFKQSWGLQWGVKGHFYVTFDDFNYLLGRDGEACVATEIIPIR